MSSITIGAYQDPSFYSKWEDEEIREVNWDKLPATRDLNWHEVTKVRNAVSVVLFGFSIATSTAILFTALPIVTASFAIGSVALLATSIYLRIQPDNPLDPDFRMQQRNNIKYDFEVDEIPEIDMLDSLVTGFIITEEEKQVMLQQDIYATGYDIFINKHGQDILDELDSENLSLLKLKFLAYLSDCEVRYLADVQAILDSKANEYFQLTEADLTLFLGISEDDKSTLSKLYQLTSQVSAYVLPAFKLAEKLLVPSLLKNAADLGMISAKLGYAGKGKACAAYAMNALSCVFMYSTKEMMKVLYPDAYAIANQQALYEKTFNSAPVA